MSSTTLWFDQPAAVFTESCPLGNGRLGAMLFGGVAGERIVLNESSVWSGGPQDADRPDAFQSLPAIRRLLAEGNNPAAEALVNQSFICQGKGSGHGKGKDVPFGCYQTLGDLRLAFAGRGAPTGYRRELDLESAAATVVYRQGGTTFRRTCFVSAPGQVIVLRLAADRPGALSFTATLWRPERGTVRAEGNDLLLEGRLNNGTDGNGLRFQGRLRVLAEGGTVRTLPDGIQVEGADAVTLLVAAETDFKNSAYPARTRRDLDAAAGRPFEDLLREHTADYRSFFDRTRLSLASTPNSELPMAARLAGFAAGAPDPALAALYFHYGRYLLISSSRPDSPLPANLQGLWAEELQTPWNGDYHLDINVQMNYWPAGPTGLLDCQDPLVRLIESLAEPGRRTARAYYNARGWVSHVITNVWGFTAPGDHASWGSTCTGSAWLCAHLWEQYQFRPDRKCLERIYPVLREAALFYLDMLVEEPGHGWLVTSPSNSPENRLRLPDGREATTCMGPAMDQQLVRELFGHVLEAGERLGVDAELRAELAAKRARLAPDQVGRFGQLQEWLMDYEECDPRHRHTSHLYGLYPGDQMTEATPALFNAVRVTLERRGDEATGWALAWRAALWARLLDGDRAHQLLARVLKPTAATGINMSNGGGSYANLFCAHPPFQIDGNFGGCAAIAEMLLQSHEFKNGRRLIRLLPALPAAWPDGEVTGLRGRDDITVDLAWRGGMLRKATLQAGQPVTVLVRYGEKEEQLNLQAGERFDLLY
jgi:alpha-L-fucosidase 2